MTAPAATNLRPLLAHVPTPVTLVAALVDGRPTGTVIGSFVGLSLDPPLVGISVQLSSSTWPVLRGAEEIGVSVLTGEHAPLVRQLAGPPEQRFTGVGWSVSGRAVFLDTAVVHLRTRLVEEFSTGDHLFAVLRVEEATADNHADLPLIFHGSELKTLSS